MSSKINKEELTGNNILDNIPNENKSIEELDDNNSVEYKSLKIKKLEEYIENLKNDRELKKNTQNFIKRILFYCVLFTLSLIAVNAISKFFFDKELYTENFLTFLIGSQLIVLPFSLLYIVAKHLFPNKER